MDWNELTARPRVMGILNCTPDSFYDGAEADFSARAEKALNLLAAGADIIDVGGESTRPGATPVSAKEECARVVPVIKAIRRQSSAPISIDTRHAETARAALDAGADIINDVLAADPAVGGEAEMLEVARTRNAPIILMHSRGLPTAGRVYRYENLVREVTDYLLARAEAAQGLRVVLDPGFGFGKNPEQNWELFRGLPSLCPALHRRDCPVLVGVSQKSMFGGDPAARTEKSVEAAVAAVRAGADWVRVHNVRETRERIKNFL